MRAKALIIAAVAVIIFSAPFAIADDCDYINENKVCWDSGSSITLGWTYAMSTAGGYQIEIRDFDWLGSASVRVTRNDIVKEGIISEGDSYIFNFTTGSNFEGVKIVADTISNINTMPPNIGVYPANPQARIIVKLPVEEKKKAPSLGVDITTEGEVRVGSRITAYIKTENSGDADLANTELVIYFDGLKPMMEYDINKLSEGIIAAPEMQWENASVYRLTPFFPYISRNGFLIKVLNFSNKSALISTSYNLSTKNGTLSEGNSITFDFTREKEYIGVKILGSNLSSNAALLVLQFPEKNSLKQRYHAIFKGSSESVKLSFLIPVSSKKSFTIIAYANGKDEEGSIYSASRTATISLSKTFSIKKSTSDSILAARLYPESYYRVGDITAMKNITYVTIRVDNLQSFPVYGVRLVDSIPSSFNFVEDANRTSISWVFDINASDNREFTYGVKAKRQGTYNLPKAELIWSEFGEEMHEESESPRTTASAPYIGIDRSFKKSSVNPGDTVQVTLSIINSGDLPTNITVKDTVPRNTTFLSGRLSYSGFINPGDSASIIYNISVRNEGIIEFQAPAVTSKNQGFEWYAPPQVKKLVVLPTAPASLPEATTQRLVPEHVPEKGIIQIINEKLPWLEGAISITMFLFAIILLLMLNKIKMI